jgi:hypothetical protein
VSQRKIVGGIEVGMITVATRGTGEERAVAMPDLAASGAELAGMMRVNIGNRHVPLQSLILYKFLELGEWPGLVDMPLPFSNPSPLPNMLEVFHNEDIIRCGISDNPLADDVVEVADYPAFLARQLFQEPFSSLSAFGLEGSPQIRKVPPYVHSLFARKPRTARSGGEVVDAEVYPDRVSPLGSGDSYREDDVNVITPLSGVPSINHSGRCRLLPPKEMPLIITKDKRDFNSTLNGRKRHHLFSRNIAENPLVINHRSRFEFLDLVEFPFGRLSYSGNSPDGKIGSQPISVSYIPIAKMLELHLVGCAVLFRDPKHIVTSIGESLKGGSKSFSLLNASSKFARGCFDKFHGKIKYITLGKGMSSTFLLPLKEWASCA